MQVDVNVKASLSDLERTLSETAQTAKQTAADMKVLESAVANLENSTEKLVQAEEDLAKAQENVVKGGKKQKQTTDEQKAAIERMASAAEMSASSLGVSGRVQETLIKIGGQYAEVLRAQGSEQGELRKAWQAGLSPAENSARKLAELVAKTGDSEKSTRAYSIAVGELADRLEDQIRRQDANVGSQNKLARSLAEHFDELKKTMLMTKDVTAAMENQEASVEQLTMAIQQLELNTGDAEKESESYKNTLKALQDRLKGAKTETEKAADSFGHMKKKLDSVETAMSALNLPGAGLVNLGKQLADSFETASETGSKISPAFVVAGASVAALTLAVGGAVVGVYKLVEGIVDLTNKAPEWDDKLKSFGLALKPLERESIDRAKAGLDGIGTTFSKLGVEIASTFSPTVTEASTTIVAMGLAAIDAWKNLGSGDGILKALTMQIGYGLANAMTISQKAFVGFIEVLEAPAKWAGLENAPIVKIADYAREKLAAAQKNIAEGTSEFLVGTARDVKMTVDAATSDYRAAAEKLVATQARVNKAAGKSSSSGGGGNTTLIKGAMDDAVKQFREIEDAEAEMNRMASEMGRTTAEEIQPAWQSVADTISGPTLSAIEATNKAFDEGSKKSREMAQQIKEGWANAASSIAGTMAGIFEMWQSQSEQSAQATMDKRTALEEQLTRTVKKADRERLEAQIDALKEKEKREGKSILRAFRLSKAASITQAGIETALASIKAYSMFGPPPSPVGIASAIAAAAAGALSIAAIAKQQPPAVAVSDAYFGPETGGQTFRTAPGDEVIVRRSGELGRSARDGMERGGNGDRRVLEEMQRNTAAIQRLESSILRLFDAVIFRQHQRSVAPAGMAL